MTATDELRRLLDARGVEYEVDDQGWVFYSVDGFGWVYVGSDTHGQLMHQQLLITPEQAIAATLGAGTCVNMDGEADAEWFTCSECNTELRVHEPFDAFSIHYCPNCGRRVVE